MISLIWGRYYMSRKPFVFVHEVDLTPPSVQDKTADADRLKNELKKNGLDNVTIPLNVLRRLPEEIRGNHFRLRLVIGFYEDGFRLLDIVAIIDSNHFDLFQVQST